MSTTMQQKHLRPPNYHKVYINNNAHITVSKEELVIIQEKIKAWKKVGISTAVGAGAGIASASAAQSILVPATLWNSTLSVFGLGSGVLVSSSTFALATTVFPVSIGGAVFIGSMFVFKKREKANLSKFLSDVIISSMPIIYADGKITEDEISQIQRLSSNPEIRDTDRKRILKALENPIDLDYVCDNFIMYEKKSKKAEIKARLLLSIAWELAKGDEEIHPKEVEMHDRMATIFAVEENYTKEVRLLLTPSYESA
ncbi:MAG: TerB family tellurite resistance protein [Thermodesulfobacteriota bacterium]|nr:TerB family tellurite resistance protein [Thermodesulfobacteriota bacterium]